MLKYKQIEMNQEIIKLLEKSTSEFKNQAIADCEYRIKEARKGDISVSDYQESIIILGDLKNENN